MVLIDRDGTINIEKHYISSPEQIEILPHAAEGIKMLRELGLQVIIITNQSGIGRGFFDLKKLEEIHHRLQTLLKESGTSVDAIYFCPHLSDDECHCRKPSIEMARQAGKKFTAELSESFVVGDNVCDIEFGKNIGAITILVRTGYGSKVFEEQTIEPDYIVENLFEAACLIKGILEKTKLSASLDS
jgi:D-glycero-D-manno-heptose 1,7-bisphosphate phosphatase